MRDTVEFPEGTEQAKPTNTRTRTPARSRGENAAAGSQEQETKPATRRRTPPSSHGSTRHHNGNEQASASSEAPTRPVSAAQEQATTARPAPSSQGQAPSGRPAQARPTQARPAQRPAPTQQGQGSTTRPGPSSQGQATTSRPQAPSQGHTTSYTPNRGPGGPRTDRPERTDRGAGNYNSGGPRQFQRPAGTTAPPAQRPGQDRGHYQRTDRPVQPDRAPQRTGGGPRPGGQTYRGGGSHAPTSHRPGGQGQQSGHRPRTTTPAQRTQERRAAAVKEKITGPVSIPAQIMVKDLAELLHATPNEVIRNLITKHSVFASINQVIDYEKAALVATDLGFEPSQAATKVDSDTPDRPLSASEAMVASRHDQQNVQIPPVVTIMGHVDHGKTSLLDVIRKTKVAAGEAGGITQHIGAYQVEINAKKITFLDTPGHEAFTAMRARGAQGAHIAIIVIAADDGVMPQTREAIDHAQAAKVPIIIALNKIDKANANPDRVKQQLAEMGIVIEEYGGETILVPVSARKGEGIDELLEYILLVAEMQDIRANPNRPATGVIIEARLEKNSGPTATVLVHQGTLKMGDSIVVGTIAGKVRAMFNDRGKRIQKAPPSTPVSIMGLPEVPQAGDPLEVTSDERTAKLKAQQEAQRRTDSTTGTRVSLDTLYSQVQEGTVKELILVLKTDVQGSSGAIKNALSKVGEENIKVRLIHEAVGNISETDVHLAAASGAIIIGFNVKADGAAQREAQKEGVDIRFYNVIYKLTDDIQAALTGMLEPTFREVIDGHAEVMQTFKSGKSVVIAGCRVTDGKITRSSQARVMRGGTKVYEGKIGSLRRGKDDIREVATGYECGIVLEDYMDVAVGDIIEAFSQERVKPGA